MRDWVLCLYSFVRPGLVQVDLVEIKKLSSKIKVPRSLALNRFDFSSFRTLLSLLFWWFIWIWAFVLVLARWICARILEEHVYRPDLVVSLWARSLGILTKVEKIPNREMDFYILGVSLIFRGQFLNIFTNISAKFELNHYVKYDF